MNKYDLHKIALTSRTRQVQTNPLLPIIPNYLNKQAAPNDKVFTSAAKAPVQEKSILEKMLDPKEVDKYYQSDVGKEMTKAMRRAERPDTVNSMIDMLKRYTPKSYGTAAAAGGAAGLGAYGLANAATGNEGTLTGGILSGVAGAGLGAAAKYFSPQIRAALKGYNAKPEAEPAVIG